MEVKSVGQFPTIPKERSSSFRLAAAVLYKFSFMEDGMIEYLAVGFFALFIGIVIGWLVNNKLGSNSIAQAREASKKILDDAEKEAKNIKKEKLLEVKDEWFKKKQEFDVENNTRKQKLAAFEKKLELREESLEKKYDLILQKEKEIKQLEKELVVKNQELSNREKSIDAVILEQNQRLEKIASMTAEEAKKMLMENMISKAKSDAIAHLQKVREDSKIEAKKIAQKVVIGAIQKTAVDHSVESTVSVVQIQNDEMKGRIIGREGRNIRAFEAATGVDVIVDDTPEAVILSAFDQFRREVARISLERLIQDGRIHPARIEEVVQKVQTELEEEIIREGENALLQLGLHGVHPELVKHIGRMKYRSSYGQNLLQHSIEVAYITGFMAVELGIDQSLAKKAGLMHDIGKTVDKSIEGPHALLGYDLAKKYKEHPIVVNAIGSHHEDIEMEHPIAALVQAADAISGARPGARREPLESYVKRLENLETLAQSFEGVAKTYAIQAGREIRVVVEPDRVDDEFSNQLAYEIAQKIENEMEYPGQIKVLVIREVRKIAYAK